MKSFIKYKIVVPIRGVIYKLGGRPKYGSIWHSPSLHLHYALQEYSDSLKALRKKE